MVANWPVAALVAAAILLFRWRGDPWPATLGKTSALVVGSLVTVAFVAALMAWWQ